MLHENRSLEKRWTGRLDGQLEYKRTIYATYSASAYPPLHKSAYGAADLLKTGEVQTNKTGIHPQYNTEREREREKRERGITLSLLW